MARILVVEDNPPDLRLASLYLRTDFHEVIPAHDAWEAEAVLSQTTPDAIVMDLGLPGKDGVALTREVRRRPQTARLPILVVTSYVREQDERNAREAGCDDYLRKPVDRLTLVEHVRRLVPPSTP